MVRAVVDWVAVQDTAVYVNNFPVKLKLSYKRISTIRQIVHEQKLAAVIYP